ncbi:hypothetical protein ACS77P_05990 [Yersinia enterocolitica]|uniref:hypothetical protein n=1 Tax=Yersinia enterocolitica TaxID=630 RepID=UPI003F428B93
MMITVFENLLLALFLLGQITLLIHLPVLFFVLFSAFGVAWCYQPINKLEEK